MLRFPAIVGLLGAALGGVLISAPAQAQAEFRGLGGLLGDGSIHSSAFAVNADGSVVVGQSAGPNGPEAFRWTERHGMQGLGDLPGGGFYSAATAVSADGQVVVGYGTAASGISAMRWTPAGSMEDLGGASIWATGVSADGSVIVGVLQGTAAFRWTAVDGLQALNVSGASYYMNVPNGVSADGTVIVGGDGKAVRWTAAEGVQPVGSFSVWSSHRALAVSGDGSTIIGSVTLTYGISPASIVESAFNWTSHGGAQNLGALPSQFFPTVVRPYAVNANGTVIVGISQTGVSLEAFLWTPAHGMRSLREILTVDCGLDVSDWSYLEPRAISADGTVIAGLGARVSGQQEAWRARITVPAPCADISGDGVVDFDDITAALANWGSTCP